MKRLQLVETVLLCVLLATIEAGLAPLARAQAAFAARLVTLPVDPAKTVFLPDDVRREAIPANDRGVVVDSLPMNHMILQLNRPADRETALEKNIEEQYEPGSAHFHQWLTAAQFGEQYGPNPADVEAVSDWLKSEGFTINSVSKSGMTIDFSGTADEVNTAFRAAIHNLSVAGVKHVANMQAPQIPAALSSAVFGVVSLNDFRPHAAHNAVTTAHIDPVSKAIVRTSTAKLAQPADTVNPSYQLVVPDDLHTIYNFLPAYDLGYTGKGQTVAVIEDTNVYTDEDWKIFRDTFGLSRYTTGTFTQVHPGGCLNPGVVTVNDSEAIIDAEYASAAAPGAQIVLASCADTATTFGGLLALRGLIDESAPPLIMSLSYVECEADLGAAGNAAFNAAYQQAASEGVSIFVSTGDAGAAGCNAQGTEATLGIAVNGYASTPYNVAVGGTDFSDTFAGTNSDYWGSTNTSSFGSAKSYIPEIPWNASCASTLLTQSQGYGSPYGSKGFCNSTSGEGYFMTTTAASGGPSGCAYGSSQISDGAAAVSGTCKGYAKPSYQESTLGDPSDGVRDLPDVSLFASNGVWGHFYVFCYSDYAGGGSPCTGNPADWSGAGGTSFAAPIVAGVQALINQAQGAAQGNPNYVYYALAKKEYEGSETTVCNASLGNGSASECIFHDVTEGDMDVNCVGAYDCYLPSGANGVLSLSSKAYEKAYGSNRGWDFATGIGSLNVYQLLRNWTN